MFTWHEKYVLANNYRFSLTSHMTLQIHITNMKMHYLPSFLTCWPLSLMPNFAKMSLQKNECCPFDTKMADGSGAHRRSETFPTLAIVRIF